MLVWSPYEYPEEGEGNSMPSPPLAVAFPYPIEENPSSALAVVLIGCSVWPWVVPVAVVDPYKPVVWTGSFGTVKGGKVERG